MSVLLVVLIVWLLGCLVVVGLLVAARRDDRDLERHQPGPEEEDSSTDVAA